MVNFGEETLRHLTGLQTVAILREHGMVPHRVSHAEAYEAAEQQTVIDLLDQLPLALHQEEEDQQQESSQHLLRRDRRPPLIRTQHIELRLQRTQYRPSVCESRVTDDPPEPVARTRHSCTADLEPALLYARFIDISQLNQDACGTYFFNKLLERRIVPCGTFQVCLSSPTCVVVVAPKQF